MSSPLSCTGRHLSGSGGSLSFKLDIDPFIKLKNGYYYTLRVEAHQSLDFWKFVSYPRPTACQASRLSEVLHECGRREVWVSQRPYPGGRPGKSVFFVKGH